MLGRGNAELEKTHQTFCFLQFCKSFSLQLWLYTADIISKTYIDMLTFSNIAKTRKCSVSKW